MDVRRKVDPASSGEALHYRRTLQPQKDAIQCPGHTSEGARKREDAYAAAGDVEKANHGGEHEASWIHQVGLRT